MSKIYLSWVLFHWFEINRERHLLFEFHTHFSAFVTQSQCTHQFLFQHQCLSVLLLPLYASHTHTHTHTYIHTHIYTHAHTYTQDRRTYARTYKNKNREKNTLIHTRKYTHMHTHIHKQAHTRTQMHTHAHTHLVLLFDFFQCLHATPSVLLFLVVCHWCFRFRFRLCV